MPRNDTERAVGADNREQSQARTSLSAIDVHQNCRHRQSPSLARHALARTLSSQRIALMGVIPEEDQEGASDDESGTIFNFVVLALVMSMLNSAQHTRKYLPYVCVGAD